MGRLLTPSTMAKLDVRVVLGDGLDDGGLGEADADDEVVPQLGEGARGRLEGDRIARLRVAQDDGEVLRRPRDAPEGRGVEGTVVLAAAVEDDADVDLPGIGLRIAGGAAQVPAARGQDDQHQSEAEGLKPLEMHNCPGRVSRGVGGRQQESRGETGLTLAVLFCVKVRSPINDNQEIQP